MTRIVKSKPRQVVKPAAPNPSKRMPLPGRSGKARPADLETLIPEIPESEPEEELEQAVEPEEGLAAGEDPGNLGVEDPFELNLAELAAELSDDPVRLYLREIGQVKLLDAAR